MARENEVKLIGKIEKIEKDDINKIGKLTVTVIRRNGRIDNPTVIFMSDHYDKIKDLKQEDFVMLKGFFATIDTEESIKCEHCGKITNIKYSISEVIGIFIIKLQGIYSLNDFKEVSNNVVFLGPLCRNVRLKDLPSGAKNAQYQMAISRKIKIKGQEHILTDFPFISSLDKQAEEDYKRMEEGSQCWIYGGIQTRSIILNKECSECGQRNSKRINIMEVCPYNVEYLFNCKFED